MATDNAFEHTPLQQPSPPRLRSPLEQFVDSFFQEKNIRWMLVIGAAIVFGSSLMLVMRQWSHWPAVAQFATILGYTGAIFGFAQLSRYRLGLLATAKVLDLLTLLLLPVTFLSLSWLTSPDIATNTLAAVLAGLLMIPATALTWFAATRVIDCWLRERQTTFIGSYLVLCMSGALPLLTNSWLAAFVSILLWIGMTAGVVKVNRHVFWLVEEHRSPRVFGFLPIGLLGLQFILLIASKTFRSIPLEWIGLGCTAVSATILLTSRSIANVYRQRTGDLVRPLPWSIIVPMLVGITLMIGGVLTSFYGFSFIGPTTYAVVPTAFVAASLMIMLARETKHSGFVWAGLVLFAIAYQSTPTLVSDLVQQFKANAATALNEEKLPFAFYGLTYLPLLVGFAISSLHFTRRKSFYLSKPFEQFATTAAYILFALSCTNGKAMFLVACVNTILFLFFAAAFRDRSFAVPALLALTISVGTWVPFGNSLGWFNLSPFYAVSSLAVLATLLVSTRIPDRLLKRIPHEHGDEFFSMHRADGSLIPLCKNLGLLLASGLGILAMGYIVANLHHPWHSPQLIALGTTILAAGVSTIAIRQYFAGLGFWLLAMLGTSSWILGLEFGLTELITVFTVATTTVSLLVSSYIRSTGCGRDLQHTLAIIRKELGVDIHSGDLMPATPARRNHQNLSLLSFIVPLGDISFVVALLLTSLFHLPMLVIANAMLTPVLTPIATSVALLWLLVLGLGYRNQSASAVSIALLPLWSTAILNTLSPSLLTTSTLPLVWVFVAGTMLLVFERLDASSQSIAKRIGKGWLIAIIAMSFLYSNLQMRASGLIALGMLTLFLRNQLERTTLSTLAIIANLQVLLMTGLFTGIHGWVPPQSLKFLFSSSAPCVLPVIGLSILCFDRQWSKLDWMTTQSWTQFLRCVFLLNIVSCFAHRHVSFQQHFLVILGIVAVVIAELIEAARTQKEARVWSGIALALLGGIYLACQRVIVFGTGISLFAMLGIAILSLIAVDLLANRERFQIFVRPLRIIGVTLPGTVVAWAVVKQLGGLSSGWNGFKTLALLSAACIYFHRGLVTKQRRYHVAAGLILNTTLAIVWHSMRLYDFQLYLVPLGLSIIGIVELLRKEIPASAHDPLRYAGALTILVSPVFEILHGSWLHLFSLMTLSVLVILLSIGLRLRVLVYTGSAFLMADMVAMVVRTTIDHPSLLWVGGLGLGVAVIALAAVCERHREQLLQRVRVLSNELAAWN